MVCQNHQWVSTFIDTMANKDATDYLGDSWGKYYCKAGKEVVHVNDIHKDAQQRITMIVDKVIRSEVKAKKDPENPDPPSRIVGIKVHWYKDGEFNTGLFHTKELVPKDVIDQDMYKDWTERLS